MKQIFLVIIVCLSFSFSSIEAQPDKKLQKKIEDLTKQKEELNTELNSIKNEIALIENRKFERETPEQVIRKKLARYDDVRSLVSDESFQLNLKNSQLNNTYSLIIDMYKSLLEDNSADKKGGYVKKKNDFYKEQIGTLKTQLSLLEPSHKESFIKSFDELASLISDYRFTMFELDRVFDVVDEKEQNGMEKDKIYSSLKADEETVFIDRIPYTLNLLRDYINGDSICRKEIREYESLKTIK